MAAAQVWMGQFLEKRSMPSAVKIGDKVWLDSKHTPVDISYKLTARWFGPFEVLESRGAQVTLDLSETFGKAHLRVNIHRFKFFEERDARLGGLNLPPTPLVTWMVLRVMRSSVSPTHARTRDRQNCGWSGRLRSVAKLLRTTRHNDD